ncbi:hypothetical protein KR044_001573, partial [Drosophila immigrans]
MHLTKGTFLLLTLCLSCTGIWAKPSLAIVTDLLNGLGDATGGIIEGFKHATKDGAELTLETLGELHDTKSNFLSNALEIAANLSNAISDSLTSNLQNLTTSLQTSLTELETIVSSETNRVKKKALQDALAALNVLNSTAVKLQAELADISEKIGGTIDTQVQEAIEELKQWGEEQLKRVDENTGGAGVAQAKDLINAVVNNAIRNLQKSLEEVATLKSLFELQVNNAIEKQHKLAKELIAQMKRCSSISAIRCQLALADLTQKVLAATYELKALQRKGQELIASGVYTSLRVKQLLAQIAKEKAKCVLKLDGIIKDNKVDTTTAASSTDESTSASD